MLFTELRARIECARTYEIVHTIRCGLEFAFVHDKRLPQESKGTCPTLEEICRELQVVRLTAYSREPGMGFEECLDYTRDGGLTSDSRDLYPEPIADYLEENEKLPDFNEVMG